MYDLDALARSQWGLLTTEQLRVAYTARQISVLVRQGTLVNMHIGVYRLAGAPNTWQQQVHGALLAVPHGVASHESAASIHGLRIPPTEHVHVTVRKGRSSARNSLQVHRLDLLDHHIHVVDRFRCTTVERTFVDIAGRLSPRELAFALDEAVIARKTTYRAVADVLCEAGSKGRKGAALLRSLLDERLPLADSVDSTITIMVLKAVKRARLPKPETEYCVSTKLGPYYIDVAWPRFKVGAEADGYTVHSASRVRHSNDRRRRNELETLGWKILNFTYDMSVDEVTSVLRANLQPN
jgi:hypothetical protein